MKIKIASACMLLAVVAGAGFTPTAAIAGEDTAAPTFSQAGGRFTGPTTVELTGPDGAEIRYTLDGSTPTEQSPLYKDPLVLDKTTNLAAVSIVDGDVSPAEIEGYIIKTEEKPLLSFFVMSDVHTSVLDAKNRGIWESNFDTLASINADPDLIISNGDQINDNNSDTASDHQVVKTLFDENMARLGLEDTPVLMTHGNHDVGNADMAKYYGDWFPNATGGYYEKTFGDSTFLVIDTESYSGAQRAWLQGRLAALSAEPGAINRPLFVIGHRPATNTVHDGAQASNPTLTADLAPYPQAVYFSGHSHLNVNDERSIWQDGFTAVNDGSMSYTEIPHDAYQIYDNALWQEATIPTAQSLYVEVYADRTEIDRINYAAENERTYTNAQWGTYQSGYPFSSAGTLAGPTWTVRLDGSTPAEVRSHYDYTSAARDNVAPTFDGTPEHLLVDGDDVLRVPAATDDESVYGYNVQVTDAATGATALPLGAGMKVLADFQVAPRPSILDVPLAIRNGRQADAPLITLTQGTEYVAAVTAVDMYGNRSQTKTVEFVAGEDAAALPGRLKVSTEAAELIPGEATTVTTAFTNQTDAPMTGAAVSLEVPDGWHAFAPGDAGASDIAAGATRETEWVVVPSTGSEAGAHTLTAEATYTTGEGAGSISRRTTLQTIEEGTIPRSRLSIAGFSSEEVTGDTAVNAIDGDPATLWNGAWSVTPAPEFPHWITIDLGSEHMLDGYRYLPRALPATNGNLKDYEIQVSSDNIEWGDPVAKGSFAAGPGWKQVDFTETQGRYVRLTGLSSQNGLQWGGGAEFLPLGHLASQQPEVDVAAGTAATGGGVTLTVTATNRDHVPVDVKLLTAFGVQEFDDVQPGKSASHAFATGQSAVDAGVSVAEVTAEIDGDAVTRNVVAAYDAATAPVSDTTRPLVTLVKPTTAGPSSTVDVQVDATDEVGLARIVANVYQDGKLVKSTQSKAAGTSGSHVATLTLPDGAYTLRYNAQDAAGNISKTSTFDFTVDGTAPTVTVKEGESFTTGDETGYGRVSFKLADTGRIDRIELNGVAKDLTDNAWSDLNFVTPGAFGAVTGQNALVVYDVAGNAKTVEFTLR